VLLLGVAAVVVGTVQVATTLARAVKPACSP
jgi:hypothetical protein